MPDKAVKVRSGARRSFLDRASIALARKMYEEGAALYAIADYLSASISYMARLFKEFENGMHQEPVFTSKSTPPATEVYKAAVRTKSAVKPNREKKPQAAPSKAVKTPTSAKTVVATAVIVSYTKNEKYPELFKDKEMPVKPEQAICATKSRTFSGLRKCPHEGCTNRIKAKDLACPDCYHLSLVGRPPVHKSVQYVGGLLK